MRYLVGTCISTRRRMPRSFHEETVRKLSRLHSYDCLRANKAMAAWGVEARVPFLDREFLDVAMSINPQDKMITEGKMEKQILREAFGDLLPEEIAWRQKEQFSDGVGYSWIDGIARLRQQHRSAPEADGACLPAFSIQHAGDRGGVPVPQAVRKALPAGQCRRLRTRWAVGGLQHAGSGFMGQEPAGNE